MRKNLLIGVDIGGTKIQAGLVTNKGKILKKSRLATEAKRGKKAILSNLKRCLQEIWSPDVKGIGVGIAGLVDHNKGVFLSGPNFSASFSDIPLAAWLKRAFGVSAKIDNDVHCFTLGEAYFGAGRGRRSVVGMTLGTGIGGGWVIDGNLYRGRNNAAGEIGHMTVSQETAAVCGCGRSGHFEALGAGPAQTSLYRRITGKDLLPGEIEDRARSGETAAKEVMNIAASWLGTGLANIIHIMNPDIIIVGGGISRNRLLWPTMLRTMKQGVIYPALRSTPVVRAALGDDANILGAALLLSDKR